MVSGDYDELSKIFPNKTNHYVGIMPGDPGKRDLYKKYLFLNKDSKKIIIGNSATIENHHIEVFDMLEHLKDENIEIICPLSYGYMDYAKKVINKGKELFGDKFNPITEYMNYEEYIQLLSTCSVGIFNNDRQQAMGNISLLIRMGKKIYLRKGTAMWDNYKKFDININDIEKLRNIKYDELYLFDEKVGKENYEKMLKRDEERYNSWKTILNCKNI